MMPFDDFTGAVLVPGGSVEYEDGYLVKDGAMDKARLNMFASCDYAHGYRKAISDVKDWFSQHSTAIKYEHLYNEKGIDALLSCMEREHEYMQQIGANLELYIRKNGKKIEVEVLHGQGETCDEN